MTRGGVLLLIGVAGLMVALWLWPRGDGPVAVGVSSPDAGLTARIFNGTTADSGPVTTLSVLTRPAVSSQQTPHLILVRATRGAEHHDYPWLPAQLELEPGRWHVRVLTPQGGAEADVEIDGGKNAELTLDLKPSGFSVSGRLADTRTGKAPSDVTGAHLTAIYSVAASPYFFEAERHPDGRFRFPALPEGPSVLSVEVTGYAKALRPLQLEGDLELGSIDLAPGATWGISPEALGITWSLSAGLPRVDTSTGASPLQAGDVVLSIQGIGLDGFELSDVPLAAAGPAGPPVTARIRRRGAELSVLLPRSAPSP